MIGHFDKRVIFEDPTRTPDGRGGYTEAWAALVPGAWQVAIEPAAARDLERFAGGTVVTTGTHVIRGWFHAGVTTATRVVYDDTKYTPARRRVFSVTGTRTADERGVVMELAVVEHGIP